MTRGWGLVRAVLVLCTLSLAHPASADTRPWAVGVSDADQARAKELFEQGNKLLDQSAFGDALKLYEEAITIWDHPAIRYNIAVAQMNLQRPIEAYRELERALRFGAAALEADVYQQAVTYQRIIGGQIVHLTIDCVDAETRITLDNNEQRIPCPGSSTVLITPGGHKLVASKAGSLTKTINIAPRPGDAPRELIDLMTLTEATVTRHRWPRWKPWVVIAAGVAVAGVGLGFELQAAATYRSYDTAVDTLCGTMPCSNLPPVVADAYDDGRRQNRIAVGLFAAGGTTFAAGAVLLWLNRARSERIGYDRASIVTAKIGAHASLVAAQWTF
ncbi:MAG TPA: tetratricopeptide repeat protein [Kofleriaceae bacterium]|nr:tetratricopeptide repeat protein [Kofleriaceae bacterium]